MGPPQQGLLLPSPLLQKQHRSLWRLLEQRALLLLVQEYTRRLRLAAHFLSRLKHLLESQLKDSRFRKKQTQPSWSSCGVSLVSLSQELWVHLNHWRCLFSRVRSDLYLRSVLLSQTKLLEEMKQSLNLFGLQLLVLMEQYICGVLSSIGQTESDSLSRNVLEDTLAGTDLYNQVVEEHRTHLSASVLRQSALRHCAEPFTSLPASDQHQPAAFSVKDLLTILAVHHAEVAARHLHCRISEQHCQACKAHCSYTSLSDNFSQGSGCSCGRSSWTWKQLQQAHLTCNQPNALPSSSKKPPAIIPDHHLDHRPPGLTKPRPFKQKEQNSREDQARPCHTCISLARLTQTSLETLDLVQPNVEEKRCSENCDLLRACSSHHHLPALHLCQLDHSVELLLHLLISSTSLLAPPVLHTPTEQLVPNTNPESSGSPLRNAARSEVRSNVSRRLTRSRSADGVRQDWTEPDEAGGPDITDSLRIWSDGNVEKNEKGQTKTTTVEADCVCGPRSVQWTDFGRSLLLDDLLEHYHALLWSLCSKALWVKLHMGQTGNAAGSSNLQDLSGFHFLHRVSQVLKTGLSVTESKSLLEDFTSCLLAQTEHAHWDSVMCRSLSSALRDKCLRGEGRNSAAPFARSERRATVSQTMENFLLLLPPLLSVLSCRQSSSWLSGPAGLPSRWVLQRRTVGLLLASVQLSTVWVVSKAYQFLSSWSPKKFLLITQGDLRILLMSLDQIKDQVKTLTVDLISDHQSTVQNHNLHLLRQQLKVLEGAVSELQSFSSSVLKSFSVDCKRVSVEIFERTMPSAGHWRPSHRTGFPSTPSEYASLAAQTVIGQVLEAVAPLSEDARVQALSVTMTAFMEAWMEHILKRKIKFSLQGALQLKQDFDCVRELIRSDESGLSAELHRRLLSLRVFQQVDSAVLCLLQQPQVKPNLHYRDWEPFRHCCPSSRSRDSIDAVVGSNITYLGFVEGEDPDPSFVTSDLPSVDPSSPAEPYLAPSEALGAAQQDWLDLRTQSTTRRWRLPGLLCLSKTEP
ncbi:uncharacterized protein ccdc142 [Austrofundulus limnaeus]|uniref:Uncharacterized protein ccdc142 n=1 Tax=Austrofundulus limnaeus TaxID=52670 RepID=A0A2I4CWZ2_AUSLI|nr:PREDICTED: coiled-coil domain-containing protein 142 [Austrofundulus limnaeus]